MPAKKILLLCFSAFFSINLFTQSLPDSTLRKIDGFFSKWNNNWTPGCTVGIIKGDSLIFSKGYGMANLEYGIPNTAATLFHMASVSKQFAGYSIILLASASKLQLDDDIHKYLTWFPDLHQKITVRNLLNHTSGIRDQWQLLAIEGTRIDDVITQEQIVKVLSRQRELNFIPGTAYSYSNSNYTMLAEIIRSVTGKTIRQFTDSAIFKPLGMNSTHFHDDYTEIEKDRAYSYFRRDSTHFGNSALNYSNAGATSLFTNIPDMSKWVMNFYHPKVGTKRDIEIFTQPGKLSNGKPITYAAGIVTDKYKGWTRFNHAGADAGYRTFISVIPDLQMGFLVFSNMGDFNIVARTNDVANLLVRDSNSTRAAAVKKQTDSVAALLKDVSAVKKFTGGYISEEGIPFEFEIKRSKLFYSVYGEGGFLIPDGKDKFFEGASPDVKFLFTIKGKDTLMDVVAPGQEYHGIKYVKDTSMSDAVLQTYTGIYECPELDAKYGIELKDHKLVLTNKKYNDEPLRLIGQDHLTNNEWWMDHLVILRNTSKQIIGFEVNTGRVMHLKFNKIK